MKELLTTLNFRVKHLFAHECLINAIKSTLTGVVSGVASTAASGGDVLLRLLTTFPLEAATAAVVTPGVEGVDLASWEIGVACKELGGGGLCAQTTILGDQKLSWLPF
jgi:hypothetical protein